jgi:murein DD-endopeptidase MepM/ murein hydrolase activator NlpD
MGRGSTRRWCAAGAAALALAGVTVAGLDADAQIPTLPGQSSTTTTTPPPETTTTTRPPIVTFETTTTTTAPSSTATTTGPGGGGQPSTTAPPQSAPETQDPAEGDGGTEGAIVGLVGRNIPAEAQAIMDSIVRTPANNNDALVQGAALLEAAGVPRADAVRAVYGRFPVLGPTRWSDDWYFPRWTGTQFRFHQGLDMFAPYGTPVAAPVDGVARVSTNALGGLTVRVVEPDGTYWYLAHLSAIAEGLVDGQPVTTGQVVGFVGTSGNAVGTPPHLHFGVYPQAGPAAPPKPVVDAWVAEGAARVPELLAQLGVAAPAAAPGGGVRRASGTQVGPPTAGAAVRSELLWASAVSPTGGAVQLADAAAAAVSERLDWTRRAAEQRAIDLAWAQSSARAAHVLGPLTHPVLRQVVEELRGAETASDHEH